MEACEQVLALGVGQFDVELLEHIVEMGGSVIKMVRERLGLGSFDRVKIALQFFDTARPNFVVGEVSKSFHPLNPQISPKSRSISIAYS